MATPSATPAAGTGEKQQAGATAHRTVLQLEPVTYRISLLYMGSKRVRDGGTYHCVFDIKEGAASNPAQAGLPPLQPIQNIVHVPAASPAPAAPAGAPAAGGAAPPAPEAAGGGGGGAAAGGPGGAGAPGQNPAALPLSQRGDNSNPDPDTVYRIVVLDNHGMRIDDVNGADGTSNTGLLGSGGNTRSKPRSYNQRHFNEDIFPDVLFRVVVRRYIGTAQVNLTPDDLRILWEMKDPEEEHEQVPAGRARQFLTRFYDEFCRERTREGDDNASDTFGQDPLTRLRTPSTASSPQPPGTNASTVLFVAPYVNQPPADRVAPPPAPAAPAGPPAPPAPAAPVANPLENVLGHEQLNAALTAHETTRALSTLTGVHEQVGTHTLTIGVADVAFMPYPIGGDNYRFLLTLTNAGGVDLRTQQENGRNIVLQDDSQRPIPHPHCYTTGRFVMWRRVNVRLLIRVNETAANAISWARVQRHYGHAFVEIGAPQRVTATTKAQWADSMSRYFTTLAGSASPPAWLPPGAGNAANWNAAGVPYNQHFFAPFMHTPPGVVPVGTYWGPTAAERLATWRSFLEYDHVEGASRQIVQDTCRRLGVRAPSRSTRQRNTNRADGTPDASTGTGEGFFVVLTQRFLPGSSLLGAYVGEQQFYMDNRFATVTFTHELGHGVYLRHGQTSPWLLDDNPPARPFWNSDWSYVPAAGGAFRVAPYSLEENTYPEDHDTNDTVECIMSYGNDNIPTDFCAMCLQVLRYYDRVKLIQQNQSQITRGWRAMHVTQIRPAGGGFGFHETPNNLAKGSTMNIATIARMEGVLNDTGFRSAKVLDTLASSTYAVTPPGQGVTVVKHAQDRYGQVAATAAATSGDYTVTFTYRGSRAQMTVHVP
ncbi:MAG: hypothetical protein AMXMBFR13_02300 [Phycisphaerae bacterium]